MKRKVFIIVILINTSLFGQNLVPNGSFETYANCPNAGSQVYYAPPWTGKDNNSVDYFNACAPVYGVPYNGTFQYAKEGVAYAAFWAFNGINNNYREYAQVQLITPLVLNNYYYLKFYVNNAPTKYVVNNISAAITTTAIGATGGVGSVLNYTPCIYKYGNPIISDTLNWVEISGVYKSIGNEQYLTIGNFFNDANTDTLATNYGTYQGTYCFLDDVSLTNVTIPQWQYRDTTVTLGDSVLIGPAITGLNVDWFTMSSTFIRNAPGIYVKPTLTTSYQATETFNSVVYNHTVTVTVLITKVDEYDKLQNSIKIFPNPNNGNFNLQFDEFKNGNIDIGIIDVTGKVVYQNKLHRVNTLINFDITFKAGVYFVKIINLDSKEQVIKKIIIN